MLSRGPCVTYDTACKMCTIFSTHNNAEHMWPVEHCCWLTVVSIQSTVFNSSSIRYGQLSSFFLAIKFFFLFYWTIKHKETFHRSSSPYIICRTLRPVNGIRVAEGSTASNTRRNYVVVAVCPRIVIDTPSVYKRYNSFQRRERPAHP